MLFYTKYHKANSYVSTRNLYKQKVKSNLVALDGLVVIVLVIGVKISG
jgi:hypothetical protein